MDFSEYKKSSTKDQVKSLSLAKARRKALQRDEKSFTTAILCQKSRNRDTISTKTQRRRRSGKYSGEELCCAPVGHTQSAAQDADEARQATNPSRKQQGPGNKPQSSKPPRSARHSRRRHEYRPTAACIGPAQSEPKSNRTCPSRPNRTDYFGRSGPNQPCAPDRIGLHWFAAANNRPRQ